jgi:hypothetical protein
MCIANESYKSLVQLSGRTTDEFDEEFGELKVRIAGSASDSPEQL